jgi:hypothetical protein
MELNVTLRVVMTSQQVSADSDLAQVSRAHMTGATAQRRRRIIPWKIQISPSCRHIRAENVSFKKYKSWRKSAHAADLRAVMLSCKRTQAQATGPGDRAMLEWQSSVYKKPRGIALIR